jgi:hypothetical protein
LSKNIASFVAYFREKTIDDVAGISRLKTTDGVAMILMAVLKVDIVSIADSCVPEFNMKNGTTCSNQEKPGGSVSWGCLA